MVFTASSRVFAQLFGDARIAFGVSGIFGSANYAFNGAFSDRRTITHDQRTQTGFFNGPDTQQLVSVIDGKLEKNVISARVGDVITILVSSEVFATSGAGFGDTSDANAEMSLKRGLHPNDNMYQLISNSGNGLMPPDNNDLTLPGLIASVPEVAETVHSSVALPVGSSFLFAACSA